MVPGEALLATAVVMALEEEMQLLGVGYVRVALCTFSTPWLELPVHGSLPAAEGKL